LTRGYSQSLCSRERLFGNGDQFGGCCCAIRSTLSRPLRRLARTRGLPPVCGHCTSKECRCGESRRRRAAGGTGERSRADGSQRRALEPLTAQRNVSMPVGCLRGFFDRRFRVAPRERLLGATARGLRDRKRSWRLPVETTEKSRKTIFAAAGMWWNVGKRRCGVLFGPAVFRSGSGGAQSGRRCRHNSGSLWTSGGRISWRARHSAASGNRSVAIRVCCGNTRWCGGGRFPSPLSAPSPEDVWPE